MKNDKKSDFKNKIGGGVVILIALFILFGHIPLNKWNEYKKMKEYKDELYTCMNDVDVSEEMLAESVCYCVDEVGYGSSKDYSATAEIRKKFYADMREQFDYKEFFLMCENKDNLLNGLNVY